MGEGRELDIYGITKRVSLRVVVQKNPNNVRKV